MELLYIHATMWSMCQEKMMSVKKNEVSVNYTQPHEHRA